MVRGHTTENGIKIYLDLVPEANTIGIGVGVLTGSIYEPKDKRGISHLLEHMMFKSNNKYSAKEINLGLELNGGIANAFTSTFITFYLVEVIPSGFEKVLDILYSMFENDKYDLKEFENEKKVVLSEIERYENDPETRMEDLIPKSVYGNSDYGDPIAGYRETVENITKEELEEYKAKTYVPENMFIVISGNFNEKHVKLVEKYFSRLGGDKPKKKVPKKDKGKDIIIHMNTQNQIYYSLNFRAREDLYLAQAFENLVSGGLSSLTFQVIREKYGIGYRVSFEVSYIYPDEIIYSLEIPGFEKDKEEILENAIEDLYQSIEKVDEKYFEGRKRRKELLYKKNRVNIFKRLWSEAYTIALFEENYDEFYRKVFSYDLEAVKGFLEKLGDGKVVKITP